MAHSPGRNGSKVWSFSLSAPPSDSKRLETYPFPISSPLGGIFKCFRDTSGHISLILHQEESFRPKHKKYIPTSSSIPRPPHVPSMISMCRVTDDMGLYSASPPGSDGISCTIPCHSQALHIDNWLAALKYCSHPICRYNSLFSCRKKTGPCTTRSMF